MTSKSRRVKKYGSPLLDVRPVARLTSTGIHERLAALADHYGIALDEPESFVRLCVSMARDSIPGFRPKKSQGGAPKQVELNDLEIFFVEFTRLKSESGKANKPILRKMADVRFANGSATEREAAFEQMKNMLAEIKAGKLRCEVRAAPYTLKSIASSSESNDE